MGLGAVNRQPSTKSRAHQTGQRATIALNQSGQAAGASTHGYQDLSGETAVYCLNGHGLNGEFPSPKTISHVV